MPTKSTDISAFDTNTPEYILLTHPLPRYKNLTSIEVFEELIQRMYNEIYNQAHERNKLWEGQLFDLHKPYGPQRVIHSNPKKVLEQLPKLVKAYKRYNDILKDLESYRDKWHNYSTYFDTLIVNNRFLAEEIYNTQVAFIKYDSKKRTEANNLFFINKQHTWNARVQKYLNNRGEKDNHREDYAVEYILKIIGESKKIYGTDSSSERAKQEKAYEKTLSNYNPKELLNPETYQAYQTLKITIKNITDITELLTTEEQHTLETIQLRIIPDGLKNMQTFTMLKSDTTTILDTQFAELLTLSNSKLKGILVRVEEKAKHESRNYYVTNKKLLEL